MEISALALLLCGCSSGAKPIGKSGRTSEPVDFVAQNAERLLHGRRLALSLRARNRTEDVWLLAHGRLVNVSKKVRIATGGDGCYGADYGRGRGPCYEVAEPFALSRAGDRFAFFLMDTSGAPDATPPALIVTGADGSHPRQVAASLGICVLCQVSTPSWDRNGRSFVVAIERFVGRYSDSSITKIYRVFRSGRARLLSPSGVHAYSEDEPAISRLRSEDELQEEGGSKISPAAA